MSAPSSQAAQPGGTKTYELRVPKGDERKIFVSKFSNALNIDFGTWKKNAPEFVREGAQNEIRTDPIKVEDEAPKVGAGSEFGKDKRDEARRKKYTRRARSMDVPWVMTDVLSNKKYRGTKEGGVQDNSSYYIFTTVGGRIEAYPISEWFNFTPIQRYKALNEDEAEEAFERRDKVFNYFNIMYQKRLKTTGEDAEDGAEDGDGKASGGGKRRGELKIKDDDDDDEKPGTMSDSDEDGTAEDTKAVAGGKKKGKGKAKAKAAPKNKRKKKGEDNDEIMEGAEESDDGDFETRELDYETSDTEDEMEDVPEREIAPKGIDEEIEEMQEQEDEEEEEKKEAEGNKDTSIEDALANSDSDNDEEDIDAIADSRISSKRVEPNGAESGTSSDKKSSSQAKTPLSKGTKRKQEHPSGSRSGPPKKTKSEKPTGSDGVSSSSAGDGKLDEEALVRQYLTRKPITSKELLRKLTKRGVRTENLNNRVGEIIKRLNPEKTTHSGKLMLHLKT